MKISFLFKLFCQIYNYKHIKYIIEISHGLTGIAWGMVTSPAVKKELLFLRNFNLSTISVMM